MRSDDELVKIPAEHFPFNMTSSEQDIWLHLAPEDRLPIAHRAAAGLGHTRSAEKAMEEIDRRVLEKSLMAVQAVVPPPPEPKMPLYVTWDFWKWVIASILLPIVLWGLKLLLGQ